MKFFILFFILFFNIFHAFSQADDEKIKRNIAILKFSNETNDKNFIYLEETIRDMVFTKLQNSQSFYIENYSNTDEMFQISKFTYKDLSDAKNIIKFAFDLKVDVVIFGSYKIDGEKIAIRLNIFDVLEGNMVLEKTIEGTTDTNLLNYLNNFSIELIKQIVEKLPIMNKKDFDEKYVKRQKISEIKISSDDIFSEKFSYLKLGNNWNELQEIRKKYKLKYEAAENKNWVLLYDINFYGQKIDYIFAIFKDNRITNIFVIYKISSIRFENIFSRYKNQMIRIFGNYFTQDNKDSCVWDLGDKYFEIFIRNASDYYNNLVLHYSMKNDKTDKKSLDVLLNATDVYKYSNFKNAYDFSIGAGFQSCSFDVKWAKLKYKIYSESYYNSKWNLNDDASTTRIDNYVLTNLISVGIPFSFSYYFTDNFSFGFTTYLFCSLSYNIGLGMSNDVFTSPGFSVSALFKYGNPQKKIILICELGTMYKSQIFFKSNTGYVKYSKSDFWSLQTTTNSHLFNEFGPYLFLGGETRYHNFSVVYGGFIAGLFGNQGVLSINPEYSIMPESYNNNLTFGIDIRFNYYTFKKIR